MGEVPWLSSPIGSTYGVDVELVPPARPRPPTGWSPAGSSMASRCS